ncbi:MAG: IS1182 family transposase [Acidimicrobiales bacterium]
MAINVREADREQLFLLPPSMMDWLPEDHLAFFILDIVEELDLSEFYESYRDDGRGGATYDPKSMLAVLLYAYCVGERSSRRIERRLTEDIAFRVLAVNQQPDHATLARFRARHEEAIAGIFAQVLGMCARAGLVRSGVVAIDGTKIEANASAWSNRSRVELAKEILDEVERTDAEDDRVFGERRGDELPAEWSSRVDRRSRVREALRQLEADGASDLESVLDNRARREAALGRKLPGRKPGPNSRRIKTRFANTTDPDSRMLRARNRFVQGYNAQAAVAEDQIIVAAEVTNAANDSTMLLPMTHATKDNLEHAGSASAGTFVADTGYWSAENAEANIDSELLISPMPVTSGLRDIDDPRIDARDELLKQVVTGTMGLSDAAKTMGVSYNWARHLLETHRQGRSDPALLRREMIARLESEHGRAAYAKRKILAEPVFGNVKANLRFRRFSRRGMNAALSEWRLICSVHNLMKIRSRLPALA